MRIVIREKRRGKLSKGILLQQDNARVHTCKIAMDAVERNGYELIPHPPYSPDLAPSDYFLFPNLKKGVPWTSFPVQRRSRGGMHHSYLTWYTSLSNIIKLSQTVCELYSLHKISVSGEMTT